MIDDRIGSKVIEKIFVVNLLLMKLCWLRVFVTYLYIDFFGHGIREFLNSEARKYNVIQKSYKQREFEMR